MCRSRWGFVASALVGSLLVGACSNADRVAGPAAADVVAPTFRPLVAIVDAPQLAAIPQRNTAGLDPDTGPVDASLLPEALAALAQLDDAPTELIHLSLFRDMVSFSFYQDGIVGRRVAGSFDRDDSTNTGIPGLYIGDPSFQESDQFAIADIDAAVLIEATDALAERFPNLAVGDAEVDSGEQYGFGPAWVLRLSDAQGYLAEVVVTMDGAVVAVAPW